MSIIQQKPVVPVALYESQSSMAPSGKESKSFVTPPFDVLSAVGSVFYHDKLIGMLGKTQRVEKWIMGWLKLVFYSHTAVAASLPTPFTQDISGGF